MVGKNLYTPRNKPLEQVKEQKDKKHICRENEMQLEVAENLVKKSSVTQAQCLWCILQTNKQ